MSGHGEKLRHKAERLIGALLTESTLAEACQVAGVATSTARRWLHEPHFQARYAEARGEVVAVAIGKLQALSAQAVAALQQIISDGNAGSTARVNAAKGILEMTLRIAESEDLAARVSALEALAKQLLETLAYQRTFGFTGAPTNGYHQPAR